MKQKSGFFFPHIVIEEEKQVWIYLKKGSFPTNLAIPFLMRKYFPSYKANICNKETFLSLGGQI